jgi:hypothetical protein
MRNVFTGRKANPAFQKTEELLKTIKPAGKVLLVKIIPFSLVPASKLILPADLKGDWNGMGRGIVISRGPECKRSYISISDEVYFGSSLSQPINYPNPDESDALYVTISEENVTYLVKSKDCI